MTKVTLKTLTRECASDNYFLGYEGENEANKLVFFFADGFIDGIGKLNIQRGKDVGYVLLDKVNSTYELPIKSSLLNQVGDVEFQFQVTKADGTVIKYEKFIMTVEDSIDSDTTIPEEYPTWMDTANAKLAQIDSSIAKAESVSNQLLKDKENGVFDGKDGFSPSVEVTETIEGAKIEITDKNGTTEANIYNGKDGKDGEDGFSPAVYLEATENGGILHIQDKEIYSALEIKNGEDGYSPSAKVTETVNGALIEIKDKDGITLVHVENGEDGFSPTVGVYETNDGAMISITDKNGMTAVPIKNGKDLTNPPIQNLLLPILETNSLYRGTIDESIAFSLPTVTDNTILNTIQLQVVISNYENITIDLGTTKFFGDIPELGNGSYILYYEYDGANWCVGALPVVSEV